MSDGFDPYYSWLGIPQYEQPANHYRLLGVQLFEPDAEVIRNAADRHMAFVQTFKTGKHSSESQRLLNELASAKICLTNPAKRSEYDLQLRQLLAGATAPPSPSNLPPPATLGPRPLVAQAAPVAQAVPVVPVASPALPQSFDAPADFGSLDAHREPIHSGDSAGSSLTTIIGVVAGGVVGVTAALMLLPYLTSALQRRQTADATATAPVATSVETTGAASVKRPERTIRATPIEQPTAEATPLSFAPFNAPKTEATTAAGAQPEVKYTTPTYIPLSEVPHLPGVKFPPTPLPTQTATMGTREVEPRATPTVPLVPLVHIDPPKPGEKIDLLEWAEGINWASRGPNWNAGLDGPATRNGATLIAQKDNVFPLPVIVDGSYELDVEFTRHEGVDTVAIFFPIGVHTVALDLSGSAGDCDGVGCLDGQRTRDNKLARRPTRIVTGQRHRVHIVAKPDGASAAFSIDLDDAKNYIKWEGPQTSLTPHKVFFPAPLRHVALGAWESRTEFHVVRLKMLSGSVKRDVIDDADRERDWNDAGYVRLVGEPAIEPRAAYGGFLVNQLPTRWGAELRERYSPYVTPDFHYSDDFYATHAPSRFLCPVPAGAKSFSVVGYAGNSRSVRFMINANGLPIYDSGTAAVEQIVVDVPRGAATLELIADPAGDGTSDWVHWCSPRFRRQTARSVNERLLERDPNAVPGELRVDPNDPGPLSRTVGNPRRAPIALADSVPCDEFLFTHSPSSVKYAIREGATRFTAVGYCVAGDVQFVVLADGRELYRSETSGVVAVDVPLPAQARTLELVVDPRDGSDFDRSMWCYPRLHRK